MIERHGHLPIDPERLAMLQRTWLRYLMATSPVERMISGMLLARVAKRHMGWLISVAVEHFQNTRETHHG